MRSLFTEILNTLFIEKGIIDKVVTTRRVFIRIASSCVVGGRILTGCYYTIECAGLRRNGVGVYADTRHILNYDSS